MFQTKTLALTLEDAQVALKADGDSPGRLEGYASTFSGVDSYGDTIAPGAYEETIPDFLHRGFLAHEHDWAEQLGTIAEAREDRKGLWFAADFYPDADAQKIRERVASRMARSKFVGLSIGYEPLDYEFREADAGEKLPPFADKVRILKRIKLYEVSVVSVPADAAAQVTAAKARRRLSRHQIEAVIATLQALMGDDEEDSADDLPAGDESADGKAAGLPLPMTDLAVLVAAQVGTLADQLKVATGDEVRAVRDDLTSTVRRLGDLRLDLDARLKLLRQPSSYDAAALKVRFDELTALYGPVVATAEGPSRRDG